MESSCEDLVFTPTRHRGYSHAQCHNVNGFFQGPGIRSQAFMFVRTTLNLLAISPDPPTQVSSLYHFFFLFLLLLKFF